jgi:hypothetical protein
MTDAAFVQPMAAPAQQAAAPVQQAAAPGSKSQLPRYNCRVTVNYEDHQLKNIQILKKKTGGSESSVLRAAVDVFSFLNGLEIETDAGIYLNNFLVIHQNQNGDGRDR